LEKTVPYRLAGDYPKAVLNATGNVGEPNTEALQLTVPVSGALVAKGETGGYRPPLIISPEQF
jgi:hypothetical protein